MRLSPGIFKGMYRGYPIYWTNDGYNVDGSSASCATMAEIRTGIDAEIKAQAERDQSEHTIKLAAAKERGLWAKREGDSVTLYTPDGVRHMTIRQYRNEVFDIEEKYDADVVFE